MTGVYETTVYLRGNKLGNTKVTKSYVHEVYFLERFSGLISASWLLCNTWWPRLCSVLPLGISTHLLNSSFISSTLDGWQQMAQEDWAGSNNGAT